jgi:hypothetical protein
MNDNDHCDAGSFRFNAERLRRACLRLRRRQIRFLSRSAGAINTFFVTSTPLSPGLLTAARTRGETQPRFSFDATSRINSVVLLSFKQIVDSDRDKKIANNQ